VVVSFHSQRVVPRAEFVLGIAASLSEVHVQALSQSYRAAAYRVFSALLTTPAATACLGGVEPSAEAAANAGASDPSEESVRFVESVLAAIDGERDPRCLLESLGLVKRLFRHFSDTICSVEGCTDKVSKCFSVVSNQT
jgi:Dos2-interacting transcription regulator of RNA-Pol-II